MAVPESDSRMSKRQYLACAAGLAYPAQRSGFCTVEQLLQIESKAVFEDSKSTKMDLEHG